MNPAEQIQDPVVTEIRDANLNYLMLAQQMIRSDKASAIYRLGISQSIADILDSLSNAQLIKLASSSVMLTRFRFDDAQILGLLTQHNKGYAQSLVHSAILMAGKPVQTIA
jgi:flagellar transcriptional activator FlhD